MIKLMDIACQLGKMDTVVDIDMKTNDISITNSKYVRTAILCGHNDIINYILEKANGDKDILYVGGFMTIDDEIIETLIRYNCSFTSDVQRTQKCCVAKRYMMMKCHIYVG